MIEGLPAFFSTYIPKATRLIPGIVDRIENKEIIYRIILFDHIIFNKDRNPGNLLVQLKKHDLLFVIDNTHVFINQAIWDSACLNRAMAEKDLFSREVLINNNYLYEMFFRNYSVKRETFEKESNLIKWKINKGETK